jgi:hypothetical protein
VVVANDGLMNVLVIDAFTSRPFAGNPAAVCLLPTMPPEPLMQQVAAEMNLSETAFVVPEGDGYRIRWFTPAAEVGFMRPCDPGLRPRPLGKRQRDERGDRLRLQGGPLGGASGRRFDRAGLPRQAR